MLYFHSPPAFHICAHAAFVHVCARVCFPAHMLARRSLYSAVVLRLPPFVHRAGTLIVTSPARSITRSQPITLTHAALLRRHAPSAHSCILLQSCVRRASVYDLVRPPAEKSAPLRRGEKVGKDEGFLNIQ